MKGKFGKRVIAAGLAAVLAVSMCACGKGGSSKGGKNENSALAKENVYRETPVTMPEFLDDPENGYVSVQDLTYRDGKVCMIVQTRDYRTDETAIYVLSMKTDGSELEQTALETAQNNQGIDTGVAASDGIARTEAAVDTGAAALPAEGVEEEVGDSEEEDGESNIWEYHGYGQFAFDSNGSIYGVHTYNREDYSNPEEYISESRTCICNWDKDGSLLWETEMEDLQSDESGEYLYLNRVFAADDTVWLLISGDHNYLKELSPDGTVGDKKELSEETMAVLDYSDNIFLRADGSFLIMYRDENDWAKLFITTYDIKTDTLGEAVTMPASLSYNGYNGITAGTSSDLFFSNSNGVYSYNLGDEEVTLRMNYVNSDVNIVGFDGMVEIDDKSFFGVYREDYSNEVEAGLFTYVDPAEIADKAVIVMAGNYINTNYKQRIIEFNRSSEDYRIVLKEYDSYNSYDDYNAGYTQLNNDIITGGMPDILLADSSLPVDNYVAKGLLADISKLISKDEELSQTEFLQNVWDAYSVNGKLYYVIPRFAVVTMAAKTELVGDGSDWSMEKLKSVLAGMGENAQAIGEVSRDDFMNLAMQFCGSDFIDVETGKCNFNSDDFIAMMEFAKTLPEEFNWDEVGDDYWSSYESQYRDNRTLLMQTYIGDFNNLTYQLNGYMGGEFTFVGFPTQTGNGAYINAYDTLVLSAKSKVLDGAWEFVRYYLTDEYQGELSYGLPVNKKIYLEKSVQATKRPTYTDWETKEEVEYDQTMYINGEDIIIPPLSEEQLKQVLDYMETVNTKYYYNESVLNIINEEMGSFYSGQKSAADAAAIIQSRVQLYVDESR